MTRSILTSLRNYLADWSTGTKPGWQSIAPRIVIGIIRSNLAVLKQQYAPAGYSNQVYSLARIHCTKGEFDHAKQLAREAFHVAQAINFYQIIARTEFISGQVAQATGNHEKLLEEIFLLFLSRKIYLVRGNSSGYLAVIMSNRHANLATGHLCQFLA